MLSRERPFVHNVGGTDCTSGAVQAASESPDVRQQVVEDFEIIALKEGPLNLYKTRFQTQQITNAIDVCSNSEVADSYGLV
jgi:hypothetical protein